jgi:TRAP-type C4-dicarboxylate transport system permease large subunit
MGAMVRELWPLLGAEIVVLALLTLIPGLSTWLPNAFGYVK